MPVPIYQKPVILGNFNMPGHAHQKQIVNLQKTLRFIYILTINLTPQFFPKILKRYYRLVILGTLDMPGHKQQKWQHQFVETFDIYLHAKNQLYLTLFFEVATCTTFDVYLHTKNQPDSSFLSYYTLRDPVILKPEFNQIWGFW